MLQLLGAVFEGREERRPGGLCGIERSLGGFELLLEPCDLLMGEGDFELFGVTVLANLAYFLQGRGFKGV